MLFWVEVDGYQVAVQVVNRRPNPYWRLAPYTIVYATPRQREVRRTLSTAAHKVVGGSEQDINREVQEAFRNWDYTKPRPNKIYEGLKLLYGDDADRVMEYITKQKAVQERMKTPAVREKLQKEIEHLVLVEA